MTDPQVETVARALWDALPAASTGWGGADPRSQQAWRRLAAAAIAALPPSPAELAVKRVEALANELDSKSPQASAWHVATRIRAALASPAPAPQGEDAEAQNLCPTCLTQQPCPTHYRSAPQGEEPFIRYGESVADGGDRWP